MTMLAKDVWTARRYLNGLGGGFAVPAMGVTLKSITYLFCTRAFGT